MPLAVEALRRALAFEPQHQIVWVASMRESEINQKGKARKLWDIEEGKGI